MKIKLVLLSFLIFALGQISSASAAAFEESEWVVLGTYNDGAEVSLMKHIDYIDHQYHTYMMVHFLNGLPLDSDMPVGTQRLLAEGIVDCKNKAILLIRETYAKEDFSVISVVDHKPGDLVVNADITDKNDRSPATVAYDMACRKQGQSI